VNPNEAELSLRKQIVVTRQMVMYAKSFILKNFQPETRRLIQDLQKSVEALIPKQIVIHDSVDTALMIKQAADAISWRLAASEAVWGLISNNVIIPGNNDLIEESCTLGWTTVVPGSGGESSAWRLDDLSLPVPSRLLKPFSSARGAYQPLSDPDLYLHEMSIENVGEEVEEALREAVKCFKHELYLACLAMLGKASEGAWIELGLALTGAIPKGANVDAAKYASKFEDPFLGVGKKIIEASNLYAKGDLFESVYRASAYKAKDLHNAIVWADAVRESRNSVHYGVKPSMPNSYEKVAALLIGAVPHLKMLYAIISAAESQG